jgi:hypothetical protein
LEKNARFIGWELRLAPGGFGELDLLDIGKLI